MYEGRKSHSGSFAGNAAIESIYLALYDAASPTEAVNSILAVLGGYFGVSRSYVFESSDGGLKNSNTFEWCAPGISGEKEYMQGLEYKNMGGAYEKLKNKGVFHVTNVYSLGDSMREPCFHRA
jgi:hypothetical protein